MSRTAQVNSRASVDLFAKSSLGKSLLLGTALAALVTAPALANPTGGQISTGAATITSNGNNTAVKQTSEGVVINWSSFNIGNGQTMQFYQPNAQALAVNRIGSKNASQILGTLDANGNVVLINGNGLLFGKNARVNVGSLVATSTDGTDSDLLSGKFTKAGSQSATIVNHGVITVGTGGTVALVAPNVTNTGIVNAKLGTVSLGAANKFTVDLNGDGLVSFAAQGDVNGKASVINRGRLVGANVSMTAHAAEGIATGVVNTSGVIIAQGAHEVGGTIVLDAGDGGAIDISGGKLEAKGPKGGGTITVGSWSDGSVTVNSGATLNASATKTGNGGHIQVISNSTLFAGNALAQGGILSGNGGLIETSGHTLEFLGSSINASATHGKAGTWLLDPDDLTIDSADALEISNTLGSSGSGTNVSLQTTASGCSGGFGTCAPGSGDINIEGAISWGTSNTLSLDAYHSLDILAPISITGAGNLVLQYNDEATDGTLNFGLTSTGFTGNISYGATNNAGTLTIDSQPYTLEYSIASLATDISNNPSGYFALANSYNANSDGTYSASPITTTFAGTFNGLGNTISNLTINNVSGGFAALFEQIGSGGTIANIGAVGDSLTDSDSESGGLAGSNAGTITDAFVTGTVSGFAAGGLVAQNYGTISGSYVTAAASGDGARGLGGGLAAANSGTIIDSYATGAVIGAESGGLVGENVGGTITQDYAAGGTVTGEQDIGGLVGYNTGTINQSYAAEAVQLTAVLTKPRSTEGGLVGYNTGSISNAYSAGVVSVPGTPNPKPYIGGFVGTNEGSITDIYSTTDAVNGSPLIGFGSTANVTGAYWDTETSGVTAPFFGATGLTTGQLNGSLPAGFSSSTWGTGPNLLPYFLWQYPTGTPQVIAGAAYEVGGYKPVASTKTGTATVSALLDGNSLGSVITGANGYFYFLLPPGTISSGGEPVLVYTQANSAVGASNAATLETATGSLPFMQVWGTQFIAPTSATTYSAASAVPLQTQDAALITQAAGSDIAAQLLVADLSNYGYIATGSSFTIDEALDVTDGLFVQTTGTDASISVPDALTFTGTQKLKLTAMGDVTLNDAISLTGQAQISSGVTLSFGKAITANDGISLTSNSNLVIDSAITAKNGTLALSSDGTITEGSAGSISDEFFTGSSNGGTTLTGSHNGFDTIESLTNRGAGGISIVSSGGLSLGSISAGSGALSITTANGSIEEDGSLEAGGTIFLKSSGTMEVGDFSDSGAITLEAGGNLEISQITSGGVLTLISGGSISGNLVTAATLTGSATSVSLDGINYISNLANFNDGGGSFSLEDRKTLTITGLLQSGSAMLNSTGSILETTGSIDASGLGFDAFKSASFTGANQIATLIGSAADGIKLTNNTALAIDGSITSTGNIALTTTGTGNNIAVDASLSTPGTMTLDSTGAITQTDASVVTALELTGKAVGNASLTGTNEITTLGKFTDPTGNFSLTNGKTLTVSGTVNTGKHNQTLEVTSGDLDISGALTGNTITLGSSTGQVYGGGTITASLLNVLADTGIDLTGPNKIKSIGTNETNSGPDIINNTE